MHAKKGTLTFAIAAILVGSVLSAAQQTARPGPVIQSAGPTFDVVSPGFQTPLDLTYKVVFDVSETASSATAVNPRFDTVARFLNMHARAGVPTSQLQLAMVVHGGAAVDLLTNEVHRARTETDNPNLALLNELSEAGIRIVLCGQTAASRRISADDVLDGVDIALSAMTAMYVLQAEGYKVNPF